METEQIISKLKESLEKNHGDYGRTQYIIEKLSYNLQLPKSDYLYIDRMVKLSEPEITESDPGKIIENILFEDLIKCQRCEIEISLDEKSVRKNNFWFHDKCFKKIPTIKSKNTQEIEIISKPRKQSVKIVQSNATYPQMVFSAGLLASLVGTTYFLAGGIIATIVGVCGSALYFATYKSQIISKKREKHAKIKTGIPGLDSILSGGLKKKSSVVISGPPGSGKTTLGLQFIYSGAKEFDEPGVYVTLSQSIDEVKNDCKSFGWDIEELVAKGKILLVDLRAFKIKGEFIERDNSLYRGEQIPFEHLTKFISNSVKKIKAKRIVIDSISILGMQYSDKFHMRQGLQGMIQSLENFNVTTMLISEFSEKSQIPLEWFATSGIIQLDNQFTHDEMKRTIKITKLRGIEHSNHVHKLELSRDGLTVDNN